MIFENEQEYIDIDGAKMPVYQLDPDYESPHKIPCLNCRFGELTDEEKAQAIEAVHEVMERINGVDKES